MDKGPKYKLNLLGPFGFFDPRGERIEIRSKKGAALLALVATGRDGTRSRTWLQDILWGSRETAQAQASLRRELSSLRQLVNRGEVPLLLTTRDRVSLAVPEVLIDLQSLDQLSRSGQMSPVLGEFMEGLDIPGEEGFEDWLRNQRRAIEEQLAGKSFARVEENAKGPSDREYPRASAGADAFWARPMIAVLPFENLTRDRAYDYLSQGIAEDLIEQLSRLRWLPVIGRAASFRYSTQSSTLREIGDALGARYIVEGRLRGEGGDFSLAASLSLCRDGTVLWSRRAAFPIDHAEAELESVLIEIVGALASRIDDAEMIRAATRSHHSSATNDLLWRARWHYDQYTPEGSQEASALLERALAQDPNSAEVMIQEAYFQQREIWLTRGSSDQLQHLRRLARKAIAADPRDGRGYMIAGIAELWLRNSQQAITLLKQAIELNPSLAYAYSQLGAANYLSGHPQRGLDMMSKALCLGLGEQYSYYLMAEVAMARAMLGDLDGAIVAASESIARRPAYWYAHVVRIYCMHSKGDAASAAHAWDALNASKPSFRLDFIDWLPFTNPEWPERLKQSVLGAGKCVAADRRNLRTKKRRPGSERNAVLGRQPWARSTLTR